MLYNLMLACGPVRWAYTKVLNLLADGHIVSHPKAGRTWVRVFLAHYFANLYEVKVDPEMSRIIRRDKRIPRIGFTHRGVGTRGEELRFLATELDFYSPRLLLLIRDPRDVVVSYFHHKTKREKSVDLTISEFIRSPDYGIDSIIDYQTGWMSHAEKVMTYEDITTNPALWFKRILEYFEIPYDSTSFTFALEGSSFENMQKDEEGVEPDARKARRGKAGGYLDELSDCDIKYVNDRYRIYKGG